MSALKFSKGGSAKAPVRTPDTMVSTDTVEVLLGISEGPIKGLENGARSFMADDTPLENESGEANFQNFELDVWPGSEAGHVVTLDLGGFSNPKTVGVNLAKDVPVVRAGQTAGIDAVDFRIVVGQLVTSNDKGTFTNRLTLKFEIKKTTDAAWTLAWINEPASVPPGGASGGGGSTGGVTGGGTTTFGGGGPVVPVDRTLISFFAPATEGIDMGDRTTYRAFGRLNDDLTFDGDTQALLTPSVPVTPPANPDLPAVAVAEDTDAVYTWNSGSSSWTPATTTASSGYRVLADGRRLYGRSETPPTGARPGDLWTRLGVVALLLGPVAVLVWNGNAWVKSSEYQSRTPPATANGIWSIDDKVSSPTPKDIRVFLPNPQPGDMWEYRVTKLSDDTGTEAFSEVQWESVQEISRTPMTFSGVAMARVIGRASDQFTALPQWSGDWLGRVVKMASNYDPVTRVYTGIWDGLYKVDWTDNNAWIFQDFVENDRYGLSSVFPHTVNKWKIYEFAQHCDTMVLRPDGTLRPRWTYNDYIQEPRDAKELAQYIAGSAGARYVDDGNGIVEVVIDKDDPAIAIFTPENIGEDGFSYSYTDRLTRANEITVEFVNPALNWQRDKRIVRDDPDIAIYGRIPENFIAVGCTDVDEALARARRRLIGGLTEKEIATFTTNRKGRFLAEWSVILLGDPEMGRGITGRVRAVTGARSVSLRDPVSFEPGIEYWGSFDVVNPDYPANSSEPFKLERRLITNVAGNDQTAITFASDLPDLPEHAAFILEAPNVAGFPKPYRVTNIGDDSGTGDHIRITCLELNRNKWAYIDTGEDQGEIIYSDFSDKLVLPPKNPVLSLSTRAKGAGSTRVIEVRWDKSPSRWVRRYKVYHAVNGVPQGGMDATGLMAEVEGAESGIHTFAIVAIDIRGRESLPLTLTYNVTGEARPVLPPSNLRLVGGLTTTVFDDISPKLMWDPAPVSPNFKHYIMVVSDTSSAVVLRTVTLGQDLEYRYDFVMNKTDGGGVARRNLTFKLHAVDQDDNLSPPVQLSITNPAPVAPTIVITPVTGGVNVVLSPATERDVVGAQLSVDPASGPTTIVQDAFQGSFFVPIADNTTRYIKAAYYDKFSSSGLNWSTTASTARAPITDTDLPSTLPANVAGVPTMTLATTITTDGTERSTLSGSWTAVTGANSYDIEIDDGVGGGWTETSPVASIKNIRVKTGVTYKIRVKAVGRTGLRSAAWSSYSASVNSTGDTTAPGTLTGGSVTSLARRLVLQWVSPADDDYAGLQIYRGATAPLAGTTPTFGATAPITGTVFPDTNVTAGTTYNYWGRSVDRTGNVGAWTLIGGGTPVFVSVGGGDVQFDDPAIVTGYGTSAFVNNQGEFATRNTVSRTSGLLTDFGLLSGNNYIGLGNSLGPGFATIVNQTNSYIVTDNHAITSLGTAAYIDGQQRFATATSLSLADADVYAPWSALELRPAVTQGNALTEDAACADVSAWVGVQGAFVSITDGEVCNTAIRATGGTFYSARPVPVDASKTYMVEGWYRRTGATNTAYGLVDLLDGAGNRINGDGTYWAYEPSGVLIPTTWTYYSRVFGAGTGKPIPANAVTMSVGALPNFNAAAGAVEIQGLRIVEVTTIGGSLRRQDGSLATEPQIVTGLGTAAYINGQQDWATYSTLLPPDLATVATGDGVALPMYVSGTGTATIIGNRYTRTSGSSTFNQMVISRLAINGPAQVSGLLPSAFCGIGFTQLAALTGDAQSSTMVSWYRTSTTYLCYAGSTLLLNCGTALNGVTFGPTTQFTITDDGITQSWWADGVLMHSRATPAGSTFRRAAAYAYSAGFSVANITLAPFNNAQWSVVGGTGRPDDNASRADNFLLNATLERGFENYKQSAPGIFTLNGRWVRYTQTTSNHSLYFNTKEADSLTALNPMWARVPDGGKLYLTYDKKSDSTRTSRLIINWFTDPGGVMHGTTVIAGVHATSTANAITRVKTSAVAPVGYPVARIAYSAVGAADGTYLDAGNFRAGLTEEAADITGLNTAAFLNNQAPTATSSDFAVITGATRPAPNAGTSGVLTPIGSYSTVVGNSVTKNSPGQHGVYEGGAVGNPQRGSAFIKSSLIAAVSGGGWTTDLALDDDATSFALSTATYAAKWSAGAGTGTVYLYKDNALIGYTAGIAVTDASRMTLAYDGSAVFVEVDGVRYHSTPAPAGLRLWPKVLDFYRTGTSGYTTSDVQYGAWTENTVSTVTLVPYNTEATIIGNTVTKTSGNNGGWGAGVSSRDKFTGSAYTSFRVVDVGQPYMMAGLASASFNGSYQTLDYAIYIEGAPATTAVRIYQNGNSHGVLIAAGGWALTDVWSVVYDGTNVLFLRNGAVFFTIPAQAAGQTLGFAASMVYIGNQIADIQVGPAQQAARIGQNTYDDSGGALVTRGGLITSLGTAAFIANQAAIATTGSFANIVDGTRPEALRSANLISGAYISAGYTFYNNGAVVSLNSLRPQEANANVTENRTAAFIANQQPHVTQVYPTYAGNAAALAAALPVGEFYYNSSNSNKLTAVVAGGTSGFTVSASHTNVVKAAFTTGNITTDTVTLTPSGATGAVTYTWTRVFGESTMIATSPSGSATAFRSDPPAGGEHQAIFEWAATDAGTGTTRRGQVYATIIQNI